MKKFANLIITGTLVLSGAAIKAQSTAIAGVSVHILKPVGISSAAAGAYTDVVLPTASNKLKPAGKYEITVADFKLEADTEEMYSVTMPAELALHNQAGASYTTAFEGQILPMGQQLFKVGSQIMLENEQPRGKHSAAPFEITVNFN